MTSADDDVTVVMAKPRTERWWRPSGDGAAWVVLQDGSLVRSTLPEVK